jgi:hypothetical protein
VLALDPEIVLPSHGPPIRQQRARLATGLPEAQRRLK